MLCAALFTALAPPALAANWRKLEPGLTQRAQVLELLGAPSKRVSVQDTEILAYFGGKAPEGTQQVQIRIGADGVVGRIDVFPSSRIDRKLVEESYGPKCPEGPPEQASEKTCYVRRVTRDARVYYFYPKLGLAFFFRGDEKIVFSMVFTPAEVPAPETRDGAGTASTAGASPSGAGTSTTIGGWANPVGSVADAEGLIDEEQSAAAFASVESVTPEDPLTIGGQLYTLGGIGLGQDAAGAARLSGVNATTLMDVYFDGRPTDRLRAMMVGRLVYDPTVNAFLNSNPFAPGPAPHQPSAQVQLDQLWLRFDIAQRVYVSIGRQHVKWGTGRFWNPTDFLAPFRSNLLALFDDRLGTDMLKVQIPWEPAAANFYAVGLVDERGPTSAPLTFGAAFRAEGVILGAELGASAVFHQARRPKYGFDFSSAAGPVDIHGEVALLGQSERPLWRLREGVAVDSPYFERFERAEQGGPLVQATAGVTWVHNLNDFQQLTLGTEAFYNSAGYRDAALVPWLLFQDAFQPFYAAQLYAAGFLTFESAAVFDSGSFTLTNLANLSDLSFVARVDAQIRVLRALSVEAYLAVPYGTRGGEFRMGLDLPPLDLGGGRTSGEIHVETPALEVGIGLRLKI